MPALLYVCITCDRAAIPGAAGHGAGRALAEHCATLAGDDLEVRQVACLNGCPQPCNVALRGAGRQTLRFSAVSIADCAALLAFAHDYWALAPGADASAKLAPKLRAKLTQNTPPPRVTITSS